jgi:hypothetical protein
VSDESLIVSENSAAWLSAVIRGEARLRHPDPSSVLLEQLIRHYDELPYSTQLRFHQAILELLAAARASETHLLYYLLHLVSYAKPVDAPAALRKLITSRMLVYSPEAAAAGLEGLAIATQVEYGVTPWLADFIDRRLTEEPDARIAMVALETLAFQDEVPLTAAFRRLCLAPDARRYQGEFLRSSFAALSRAGMSRFYAELEAPVLVELARDAALSRGPFVRAFAGAMDRIGERDRGYFPLRAIVAALLGEPTGEWLEQCAADVTVDVIGRIEAVQVAAGTSPLVVRPTTTPDYADELAPAGEPLPTIGVMVFEDRTLRVLRTVDRKAELIATAQPLAPASYEEAGATMEQLVAQLNLLVPQVRASRNVLQ